MDDRQKNQKMVVTLDSFPKRSGRLYFKVFCESERYTVEYKVLDGILSFTQTTQTFRSLAHEAILHATQKIENNGWKPLSYTFECKYDDD